MESDLREGLYRKNKDENDLDAVREDGESNDDNNDDDDGDDKPGKGGGHGKIDREQKKGMLLREIL